VLLTNFRKQFTAVAVACAIAQVIVDTVREPNFILGKDLRVIAQSRSFYSAFDAAPDRTQGDFSTLGRWAVGHSKTACTMRLKCSQVVLRERRRHYHSARHGRQSPSGAPWTSLGYRCPV